MSACVAAAVTIGLCLLAQPCGRKCVCALLFPSTNSCEGICVCECACGVCVCVLQTGRRVLDNGETEGSGPLVYWYSGSLPADRRRASDSVTEGGGGGGGQKKSQR